MVKALFIPGDLRVVLSGAERRGLEFPPARKRASGPSLPVTSHMTATKAHRLNSALPEDVRT